MEKIYNLPDMLLTDDMKNRFKMEYKTRCACFEKQLKDCNNFQDMRQIVKNLIKSYKNLDILYNHENESVIIKIKSYQKALLQLTEILDFTTKVNDDYASEYNYIENLNTLNDSEVVTFYETMNDAFEEIDNENDIHGVTFEGNPVKTRDINDGQDQDLDDNYLFCGIIPEKEIPLYYEGEHAETQVKEKYEYVNQPSHYNQYEMPVIDMMEKIWGPEKTALWCEMTAWKYRQRVGTKPDNSIEQDLEKEKWYLNKYHELKNKKEN